jgi:Flp pilus assembly protein TadD
MQTVEDLLAAGWRHDRAGDHLRAEQAYRLAVQVGERHAEAWAGLGTFCLQRGRPDEAVEHLRRALLLRPDQAGVHSNLGVALAGGGRMPEAVASFAEAVRLRPDFVEALVHQGDALRCCGRYDEALASLRRALDLDGDNPDAHHHLALLHADAGRMTEALAAFDTALRRRPDDPLFRKNRGLARLRAGDWANGWDDFEWRLRCREFPKRPFAQPRWGGGDLAGKTLLLWAEQGAGDTLQFVRFAALVKERGATVLLECPAALHPLLACCPEIDRLVAAGADPPAFDLHAPLMSVPGILGTSVAVVPAPVPYLFAEPALVARWQQELAPLTGFRVGVCWQGNPRHAGDRRRSFPLSQLAPLAELPGVCLVSLQVGPGAEQVAALAGRFEIFDLGEKLTQTPGAFLDAAAVIRNLDLVVSCDTSVGHLAGALGAPVWLALADAADWRWLLGRSDTPWYPTMRLFRQKEAGKWEGVFADVARDLARLPASARRARPVLAEVAPGELVDKITILEIKSERITDAGKLRNVRLELSVLRQARARALPPSGQLDALTAELKAVNAGLWEAEDAVRACERRGDFGPLFVGLARSVYHQNDRRAALKRKINELLGSQLVEEKSYAGS